MWGTAMDGAREARAHAMGAETRGTAVDGARAARGACTKAADKGGAACRGSGQW